MHSKCVHHHQCDKRRPTRLPRICAGYRRGRARSCAGPDLRCPASTGAGVDGRTVRAPVPRSRPRPGSRTALLVLRRNRVRLAPRRDRAQSARYFSTKHLYPRGIESGPAVDWSNSFRNHHSIGEGCPNNSEWKSIFGVGHRGRRKPSRKSHARGNTDHLAPNAPAERSSAAGTLLLLFPPTKENLPS